MPGSFTRAGKRRALNAGVGKAEAAIANWYVGLATADPGENPTLAGISEVTTAGYARQQIALTAASDAATTESSNDAIETWGPFTADPASIGWAFLTDVASGTGGTIFYRWKLDTARDAAINDSLQAAIAALKAQITDTSTA
jgi:hypothetical protein